MSGLFLFNDFFARTDRSGVKLLQENGFVGREPPEIARFLHSEDRLDRGAVSLCPWSVCFVPPTTTFTNTVNTLLHYPDHQIGDYLGEKDDLNIAVMHAYIDQVSYHPCRSPRRLTG